MLDRPNVTARFERLARDEPVRFASDACLIVRRPGSECGVCRDACPTGVLSGGRWSLALEDTGCVGCGLCAAACPTGALAVDHCTPHAPNAAGERIVLECRRVAPADREPNAVAVPCLGGITTPDLLDFVEETEATVVFADRGWCGDCAVGRCNAPWQFAFDESRALLGAIDERLTDCLTVERRDLPISRARPLATALRPDRQVGRRDFLKRILGTPEPRDAAAESRRVVFGRGLVAPIKRERILDRLRAVAADLDLPMPASLMPAIKIADGCELDGLCAAICPTGALRREEGNDSISLQFDAVRCIACDLCERACANRALSLWPHGDGTLPVSEATLVKRQTVACESCGEAFVAADDGQLCSYCKKTMKLMHELHSLRFGSAVTG